MTSPIAPPIRETVAATLLAQARANCAARLRSRGHGVEAENFARGDRDDTFPIRYEIEKLRQEQASEQAPKPVMGDGQ